MTAREMTAEELEDARCVLSASYSEGCDVAAAARSLLAHIDALTGRLEAAERERDDKLAALVEAAGHYTRTVVDRHCGDDYLTAERRRPRLALDAALCAAWEVK